MKSLEEIPQLAWRCDAFGQRVECNRRWYEYTGQTPDEARSFGWMNSLHPDDRHQVAVQMFKAAETGVFQVKYRLRRASDGSYRWYLAQAVRIKDTEGKTTGWLGKAIDIQQE